jgi:hypothetical protein
MKNYIRTLLGLLLLTMAMCELIAWPVVSWVEFVVPGSLISAGAVLIGEEISCLRQGGR